MPLRHPNDDNQFLAYRFQKPRPTIFQIVNSIYQLVTLATGTRSIAPVLATVEVKPMNDA